MTTTERRGHDRPRTARGGRRHTDLPGQSPLVLMAGSDDPVRRLYARYLHQRGFQVVEAGSGDEAAEVLATARPQVVVAEPQLASAPRFKTGLPHTLPIPLIVTTTDATAPVPLGAAAVLIKPFALATLLREVRRVLTLTQQLAEDVGGREQRHQQPAIALPGTSPAAALRLPLRSP